MPLTVFVWTCVYLVKSPVNKTFCPMKKVTSLPLSLLVALSKTPIRSMENKESFQCVFQPVTNYCPYTRNFT